MEWIDFFLLLLTSRFLEGQPTRWCGISAAHGNQSSPGSLLHTNRTFLDQALPTTAMKRVTHCLYVLYIFGVSNHETCHQSISKYGRTRWSDLVFWEPFRKRKPATSSASLRVWVTGRVGIHLAIGQGTPKLGWILIHKRLWLDDFRTVKQCTWVDQ